jgi:hypothetical protein
LAVLAANRETVGHPPSPAEAQTDVRTGGNAPSSFRASQTAGNGSVFDPVCLSAVPPSRFLPLRPGTRSFAVMKTLAFDEAVAGLIHLDTNYLIGLLVKGSRFDCLIAATALLAPVQVATVNQADFEVFEPHGLNLGPPPPAAA